MGAFLFYVDWSSRSQNALLIVLLGSTAIGIQTSEGVCLAVEKRITSPLMEPSSIEKIVEIDAHIGCAMSGLIADAKTLIDKARVETQQEVEIAKGILTPTAFAARLANDSSPVVSNDMYQVINAG
ncbi:Proteasome subunit alpha type-5, partial [Eschrichtius robustus]|nr:Proteasome subunit alpha type-5 [Eschrichtius robustus]